MLGTLTFIFFVIFVYVYLNINGRNDLKLLVGISDTSYARVCYLHRYLCMRTRVQIPIIFRERGKQSIRVGMH